MVCQQSTYSSHFLEKEGDPLHPVNVRDFPQFGFSE